MGSKVGGFGGLEHFGVSGLGVASVPEINRRDRWSLAHVRQIP